MTSSTTDSTIGTAIDQLVAQATKALDEYARFTQDDVDHLVKKASVAASSPISAWCSTIQRTRPFISRTSGSSGRRSSSGGSIR